MTQQEIEKVQAYAEKFWHHRSQMNRRQLDADAKQFREWAKSLKPKKTYEATP